MKRNKRGTSHVSFAERKSDLIFAGIALLLIIIMTVLLFRYLDLRAENRTPPEEYGIAVKELGDVKDQKSKLETEIDEAVRELEELNKKIAALRGK